MSRSTIKPDISLSMFQCSECLNKKQIPRSCSAADQRHPQDQRDRRSELLLRLLHHQLLCGGQLDSAAGSWATRLLLHQLESSKSSAHAAVILGLGFFPVPLFPSGTCYPCSHWIQVLPWRHMLPLLTLDSSSSLVAHAALAHTGFKSFPGGTCRPCSRGLTTGYRGDPPQQLRGGHPCR